MERWGDVGGGAIALLLHLLERLPITVNRM